MSLYDTEPGYHGGIALPPPDPFDFLRNPESAFEILSVSGQFADVSMCTLCALSGTDLCPVHASKTGKCSAYTLIESDLDSLNTKVEEAIAARFATQ